MTHHKRSIKSRQIRDVDNALIALSFHDRELDEVAFNVTSKTVFSLLTRKYGFVHPAAKDHFFNAIEERFEFGEILSDSRGRGTTQQIPPMPDPDPEQELKEWIDLAKNTG